jgi:hypothetical protein
MGPLGASVVVREGERGGGGLNIQVKAAGEGVQVEQVGDTSVGVPLAEPGVPAWQPGCYWRGRKIT